MVPWPNTITSTPIQRTIKEKGTIWFLHRWDWVLCINMDHIRVDRWRGITQHHQGWANAIVNIAVYFIFLFKWQDIISVRGFMNRGEQKDVSFFLGGRGRRRTSSPLLLLHIDQSSALDGAKAIPSLFSLLRSN